MRFGRGNLRGGNLIVETLIFPYFLRLPRPAEVVTRCEKSLIFPYFLRLPRQAEVVTYEVTELSHNLNFCRSICILFYFIWTLCASLARIFDFLKNFVQRKDPFTTDPRNYAQQN